MRTTLFRTFTVVLLLLILPAQWQFASDKKKDERKTRNIILFIGDGMGVAQLYAGMSVSNVPFYLERFPYSGLSKTFSADDYITDSAAGGTAIACGVKTNNGMIGVRPDSTAVKSIMEYAHDNGLATGVVSTSSVTHATPASFVSHNSGRGNYEDIARDFLSGTVDVFIGGGINHFRVRKDSADLDVKLREMGYTMAYTLEELKNVKSAKIGGLLAKEHMPPVSAGRGEALVEMTRKAIEALEKNKNGFVLMVEGSMIDWGAHAQNIDYVTSEVIDLDKAVGVAYDYAAKRGNTLVVVTADHETGGLTLNSGSATHSKFLAKFSGGDHTGVMVPIFSYGPGAERFAGIHDNTFFLDQFLDLLRIRK